MFWIIVVLLGIGFFFFYRSAEKDAKELYEKEQEDKRMLMERGKWKDAMSFHGNFAPVQGTNGFWGLADRNGKAVIGPVFEEIHIGAYGWIAKGDVSGWFLDDDDEICFKSRHKQYGDCGMGSYWNIIDEEGKRYGPFFANKVDFLNRTTGIITFGDIHKTTVEFDIRTETPVFRYTKDIRHGELIVSKRNIDGLWAVRNHNGYEIPWFNYSDQANKENYILWKDVKVEYPYLYLFNGNGWREVKSGGSFYTLH